jgi:hypothetical protein
MRLFRAQTPRPALDFFRYQSACVEKFVPSMSSAVPDDTLDFYVLEYLFSLQAPPSLSTSAGGSRLQNAPSHAPSHVPAVPAITVSDTLLKVSAHADPRKPTFPSVEPSALRQALVAYDNYATFGILSIHDCLSPPTMAVLRSLLSLDTLPIDNVTLRPLLDSLLDKDTHDRLVPLFELVKMHPIKRNEWDAVTPSKLHAYSHRFFIFIDSHRPFYIKEYPEDRSRFKAHKNLFCSGVQPNCVKEALLLTKDSIHTFPALLERFGQLIERVSHCVDGAAQKSESTNYQKQNNYNRNNNNTSSRPNDAVQAKPQTSTTQSAGGSRPAAVSGAARPQQNNTAGRPSALTQAKVSKVSFADVDSTLNAANLEVNSTDILNNVPVTSTDNINDNNNNINHYHEPNNFALLDSGSSIHTVPSEIYLTNITSSSSLGLDVRAANNTPIPIQSIGNFSINDDFILKNVCVAPSIIEPLVSVPLLLDDNNIVIFSKNKSIILKNNNEITSSFDSFVKFAENNSPSIPIIHDIHNNLLKIPLTPPSSLLSIPQAEI